MRSLSLLFLGACFLTGCATLVTGTRDEVHVQSDPDEALVLVRNEVRGTTPVRLSLQSDREYRIEVVKDGYQREHVDVTRGTSGWILGNVFCCGLLPGVMIDAATGGAHVLEQENVFVDMDTTKTLR